MPIFRLGVFIFPPDSRHPCWDRRPVMAHVAAARPLSRWRSSYTAGPSFPSELGPGATACKANASGAARFTVSSSAKSSASDISRTFRTNASSESSISRSSLPAGGLPARMARTRPPASTARMAACETIYAMGNFGDGSQGKIPSFLGAGSSEALTQRGAKLLDEGEYVTRFPSDFLFFWTPRRTLPILRQTIVRKKSVRTQTIGFGHEAHEPTGTAVIDPKSGRGPLRCLDFLGSARHFPDALL